MTVIKTYYDPKPIPHRDCDWTATFGDWDLGQPIGYGATEQEAMRDLVDNYDVPEPDGLEVPTAIRNAFLIEAAAVVAVAISLAIVWNLQTIVSF